MAGSGLGGVVGVLEGIRLSGDEEYDTETDIAEEREQEAEPLASEAYTRMCEILKLATQQSVRSQLDTTTLNVTHRNLGPLLLRPLIAALKLNNHLETLNLSDNGADEYCGRLLAHVLTKHRSLRHLVLSDNKLGRGGGIAMAELILDNRILISLNLSGNQIDDEAAHALAHGIEVNENLISLDLSHNSLAEEGAAHFGYSLGQNNGLQRLNLSWNKIRLGGAVGIFSGLQLNDTLVELDLSWNGLGYEGALALSEMLKTNQTLCSLDASHCQFNWQGAFLLAGGLKENRALEVLKLGHNTLTTTGCMDLIEAISEPQSKITCLDLTNVSVVPEFEMVAQGLQKVREFSYRHGGVVGSHDIMGQRLDRPVNPMQMVIDYMRDKELRPTELFRSFDKDTLNKLTKDQMVDQLKKTGIPLKEFELEMLLEHFTKVLEREGVEEGDQLIDYRTMSLAMREQMNVDRLQKMSDRDKAMKVKAYHKKIMDNDKSAAPPTNDTGSDAETGSRLSEWHPSLNSTFISHHTNIAGYSETPRLGITASSQAQMNSSACRPSPVKSLSCMSMSRPLGSKAVPFGQPPKKRKGRKKSHKK